jgi:hypothetical protein
MRAAKKPLDGSVLSLAGNALAGEGTPGGAATYPPPGRHGRPCRSLDLAWCGAREVGEWQEEKGERREELDAAACREAPPFTVDRPSLVTGVTTPPGTETERGGGDGGRFHAGEARPHRRRQARRPWAASPSAPAKGCAAAARSGERKEKEWG